MTARLDAPALEAAYDARVAPLLREIRAICDEVGLDLLAVVDWGPGAGIVSTVGEGRAPAMHALHDAAEAGDDLGAAVRVYAEVAALIGHDSVLLDRLGVPRRPAFGAGGRPS